ncbi:hypothetical protein AAW51_5531 [Caldimonas brevitalea]|uniref:Uncharacterized protein n=1 Tax=Caldimonas brevitalea TaxID=413882 RepID=A0A0G3BS14_9BURK|nr:hypothetical protein AAW51_5531 [Caldimonas brevitalea]
MRPCRHRRRATNTPTPGSESGRAGPTPAQPVDADHRADHRSLHTGGCPRSHPLAGTAGREHRRWTGRRAHHRPRLGCAAIALGPLLWAQAALACALPQLEVEASEPLTFPLRLAPIVSISLRAERGGADARPAATEDCRRFRPSVEDVRHYLQTARELSSRDHRGPRPSAPCSVAGMVRFADGRTAQWRMQQDMGGTLSFVNGREHYLYCRTCQITAAPTLPGSADP